MSLVQQQSVGLGFDGIGDLRAQSQNGLQAGQRVQAQAQVNHYQVWIRGEVHGTPVYLGNTLGLGHTGNCTSEFGRARPIARVYCPSRLFIWVKSRISAGPSVTRITEGKIRKNTGKISLIPTLRAFSWAIWRKRMRR